MHRLFRSNEFVLAIVIVLLAAGITLFAPQFVSFAHLFQIGRGSVVVGLMALGMLVVLITGEIDVSVSAVAVCSMYITTVLLLAIGFQGPFIVAAIIAMAIGGVLGTVNAVLVTLLRLPSLIVTLGTLTLYQGGLLAFLGTRRLTQLPPEMMDFGRTYLVSTMSLGRQVHLQVSVAILVILAVALALALRSTQWGRDIYAVGDNEEAARRLGVPVTRVRFTAFIFSGVVAGLAGILSAGLNQMADPFTIVGDELMVLAAVVLGGAAISGGKGSVVGTLLGILLIVMVDASLVLVGIPSAWQQAFIGLCVLFGVGIPALRDSRVRRRRGMVVTD